MVSHDERTDDSTPTRRALLRRGAGLVAASVGAATAGCASALPPLGSVQRFGRLDVPPAAPPRYRRWLPAPSAVEGLATDHYAYLFRRPTALDYPAPVRFTTPRKRLLAELDHFDVGYANYDSLLATELGTVIEADIDPARIAGTLTESGYATAGTYGDYDLFVRDDVPRRAAVGDGTIVWSSRRVHPTPRVEALLDARAGRIDRYHGTDAAVERVTDAVGESRMVEYVPPSDARTWTKCEGFRFDGDTAYHVVTFLYPEGERPPEAELRERFVRGTVLTREADTSEFRVDGRLVTVEGRIPPGAGITPDAISPPYPPQVTWGYERRSDPRALTLRHEAGDLVPVAALRLDYRADVPDDWVTVSGSRPLPTDDETMRPGDAVSIDLREPPTVRVIHRDDVDRTAEEPFAAAEPRPATRVALEYAPESSSRTLFTVALEGST